jgi:hypothetical protein
MQWKFNARIGQDDAWLDLGPVRFVYQWYEAEDGRTLIPWRRRFRAFRRSFHY